MRSGFSHSESKMQIQWKESLPHKPGCISPYMVYRLKYFNLISQQKQDQELTVAQIMNSLLPNSDLI